MVDENFLSVCEPVLNPLTCMALPITPDLLQSAMEVQEAEKENTMVGISE